MFTHIDVIGDDDVLFRIATLQENISPLLKEFVSDVSTEVKLAARRGEPVSTGNLRSATDADSAVRRMAGTARVWKTEVGVDPHRAPYAIYVERGTGIFGPTGRPIEAKAGNLLTFDVGGRRLFRKSVRGMKGVHFWENAVLEVKDGYFPVRVERLRVEIGNLGNVHVT